MTFFDAALRDWVGEDKDRAAWYGDLPARPVPDPADQPTPLVSGVVLDVYGPVDCDRLLRSWVQSDDERQAKTALRLIEALHGLEMERAARPVQVTFSVPVTKEAEAPPTMLETTPQLRERLQNM